MAKSSVLLRQHEFGHRWWHSARFAPWLHFRGPLFVAFAYYLGAQGAFLIGTLSDRIFAPFWPPNIILLCALLFAPMRLWWVYVAAVFPAHLLAEATVGMAPAQAVVAFSTNCLMAVLGAYGVRRFIPAPPWFGTLRQTAIYIAITAGVSPIIAALGGAFVQILGGGGTANYWT